MKTITSRALLKDLKELIVAARQDVARQVNSVLVLLEGRQMHPARHSEGKTGGIRRADSADAVGRIDEGFRSGLHSAESR